ncbi:MAG TPA: SPFH domain-containing protein [Vulgatibacter sp.]|nr:SPFH domain-containing protein [Vulgatibacter sp.]
MTVILIVLALFAFVTIMMGVRIVPQSQAMIVERLGRFHRVLGSGFNVIIPLLDSTRSMYMTGQGRMVVSTPRIDLREQIMGFEKVPVITRDNVTMEVGTVIYYQIIDPVKAVYEIENLPRAIHELTQTNIRNVMGSLTLDETLTSRDTLNTRLREVLDDASEKWGVKVTRVELKEIEPPLEIRNAMALQMTAERERRARVTQAEGLKAAQILQAEGERQSKVLQAEGQKTARILEAEAEKAAELLRAEADKLARIMAAEAARETEILESEGEGRGKALKAAGEAEAIAKVFDAIHQGRATPEVLALKYVEALQAMAAGPANKLFIPYEASSFVASLAGLKSAMEGLDAKAAAEENRAFVPPR